MESREVAHISLTLSIPKLIPATNKKEIPTMTEESAGSREEFLSKSINCASPSESDSLYS